MASVEVANDSNDDATVPAQDNKSTEQAIEDAIYEDPDLVEVIHKLENEVSIEPDRDLNLEDADSQFADSDSVSTSSSYRDTEDNDDNSADSSTVKNGHSVVSSAASSSTDSASIASSSNHKVHRKSIDSTASRESTLSNGKKSSSGSKKSTGSSIRNPLKALKKLTKADKSSESKRRRSSYRSEFTAVVVDKLPQVFVVKYLGHRPVPGMCGLHLVRRPVDEMVREVKQKMDSEKETELPMLYVVISPKGVDLREHKKNKVKDVAPLGVMPIDFISYGVQDIKYWRVFCCIQVTELSSRNPRVALCHAFLCDSSHSSRKMALSIGAAFNVHAKKLNSAGKAHNFQVELRPPDELADALEDVEV